jgi:ribonuclease BN (tRNA processing enzyme)
MDSSISEFKFMQWGLYKLNSLVKAFFPPVLDSSKTKQEFGNTVVLLSFDCSFILFLVEELVSALSSSKLGYLLPLAKVIFKKGNDVALNHSWELKDNNMELLSPAENGNTEQTGYRTILSFESFLKAINYDDFTRRLEKIKDEKCVNLTCIQSDDEIEKDVVQLDLETFPPPSNQQLTIDPFPRPVLNNYDIAARLKASFSLKRKHIDLHDESFLPEDSGSMKRERTGSFLSVSTEPTQYDPADSLSTAASGPPTFESRISNLTVESPMKIMRITPRNERFSPLPTKSSQSSNPLHSSFFSHVPIFLSSSKEDDDDEEEVRSSRPSIRNPEEEVSLGERTDESDERDDENEENLEFSKPLNDEKGTKNLACNDTQQLIAELERQICPPDPIHDLLHITFLGTGCATPSKYRNASSIMVKLLAPSVTPNGQAGDAAPLTMLLDVGENTVSQIYQSVNGDLDRFDRILTSIRVIWISHHHADHAAGLPLLIHYIKKSQLRKSRKEKAKTPRLAPSSSSTSSSGFCNSSSETDDPTITQRTGFLTAKSKFSRKNLSINTNVKSSSYEQDKILVIAHEKMLKYFEEFLKLSNLHELISFCSITTSLYAGMTSEISRATNGRIIRLQSVPVIHCQNSFGLVLELAAIPTSTSSLNYDSLNSLNSSISTRSVSKVVYSGDCRPSQSLIKCGKNCDLLIHEATFNNDRASDAIKKKHSTINEAVTTAIQMNAKHLILTHFSQRYPLTSYHSNTALLLPPPIPAVDGNNSPNNRFLLSPFRTSSPYGNNRKSLNSPFRTSSPLKLAHSRNFENGFEENGSRNGGGLLKTGIMDSNTSIIDLSTIQRFYDNHVSFAYDLLKVSFPSQINVLPMVTKSISKILSELESS